MGTSALTTRSEERFAALLNFDNIFRLKGHKLIAGIDEAGRGPLAGPVVAVACILPKESTFYGVDDSKKLTALQRQKIFQQITSHSEVQYGVGIASPQEIDNINIYQATRQAMFKAIEALPIKPDLLLVDGMPLKYEKICSEKIIKGDSLSLSIAAASIIAKETRDQLMREYHVKWPMYGFDQHKGYGTPKHLAALRQYGPSPMHRFSFAGVV